MSYFKGFKVPIYINCRDRITDLLKLVGWLEQAGYERIVFIDNNSTYPPLLEYFEQTAHEVLRLVPDKAWQEKYRQDNYGSRSLWHADQLPQHWFIYTDPDLVPLEDCPADAVDHLYGLLRMHPFPKAGLGLYLDDVPATMQSLGWEKSLIARAREVRRGVYNSLVDTTFALYRPNYRYTFPGVALRTSAPYAVRHLPWYHLNDPSEEEQYYLAHAARGPLGSSWADGRQ